MSTTTTPGLHPGTDDVTRRTTAPRYPLGWLRALAALAVLTFHAYQHQRDPESWAWPLDGLGHQLLLGSDLFVDMFFVLSAFVLWAPVARAALDGRPGRPGWEVLFRRSARLVPLYLTVVLLVWALTNPTLPGHWKDLFLHLTFTQIYSDDYIFWTVGPAWSLAVEFHFYVLIALTIPVVQNVVRRRVARGRTTRGPVLALLLTLPALCLAGGAAFLAYHQARHTPGDAYSVWFSAPAKAPDFAFGMALAVAAAAGVRLRRPVRLALGAGSVPALAWLAVNRPFEGPLTHVWNSGYALAITAGLAAIVLHDGPWPAWMSWRPLAWLGALGYGVYLVHEPVLRFVSHVGLAPAPAPGWSFLALTVLVAVPSVALAWLSARTVEAGGLRLLSVVDERHRSRDYYAHVRD